MLSPSTLFGYLVSSTVTESQSMARRATTVVINFSVTHQHTSYNTRGDEQRGNYSSGARDHAGKCEIVPDHRSIHLPESLMRRETSDRVSTVRARMVALFDCWLVR